MADRGMLQAMRQQAVSRPASPAAGRLGWLSIIVAAAASPHQPLASPPPEAIAGTT
jgi:hypothetical protein